MKIITVPADIVLTAPDGTVTERLTFFKLAQGRWFNEPEATPNMVKQKRWFRVIDAFEAAQNPGDTFVLEDEDHATLVKVIEKVNPTIPALAARQLVSFVDAVLNAPAPTAAHALPAEAVS